jgi:hypothetical protein
MMLRRRLIYGTNTYPPERSEESNQLNQPTRNNNSYSTVRLIIQAKVLVVVGWAI